METPSVTCVCITGKLPERRRLALFSLQSFFRQTYSRCELLSINTSGEPWLSGPNVREFLVDPRPLGELRNLAFDLAEGQYLIQWDDDDYHGSHRVANQVKALRRSPANILASEIIDFGGFASVFSPTFWHCMGFPGSVIYPKSVESRYPALPKEEDTRFLRDLAKEVSVTTLVNDPCDYIRFVHGMNTWDRDHFHQWLPHCRRLNERESEYYEKITNELDSLGGLL